jgi:translocator protein
VSDSAGDQRDDDGVHGFRKLVPAVAGSADALKPRDLLALGAFLVLCLGVGALGSVATAQSVGTWYQGLAKPAFNPPDWVFAPVWTTLYVLIAVAGWRVWRRRGLSGARLEFAAYAAQLALNLAWSILFFGQRMIGAAAAEIGVLLFAIAANAVLFWRVDRPAGWLLAPYAAWVAFACLLNFALWHLN